MTLADILGSQALRPYLRLQATLFIVVAHSTLYLSELLSQPWWERTEPRFGLNKKPNPNHLHIVKGNENVNS